MFKLFLYAGVTIPVIALGFMNSQASEVSISSVSSWDAVYVDPSLERLETCEPVKLDMFFRGTVLTTHSAEYLRDAVNLSKSCGDAQYLIKPVMFSDASAQLELELKPEAEPATEETPHAVELQAWLGAMDVDGSISTPIFLEKPNALTLNGQKAILTIQFGQNEI